MIAEQPRHGYELMKGIEERMGGGYSPSPGVIYPTLAWLEDMGYASGDTEGSRKSYRITAEGEAFLAANRAALAELLARMGAPGGRRGAPEPIVQGMDRLKRALRARLLRGPADAASIAAMAAAIEAAAESVESEMTEQSRADRAGPQHRGGEDAEGCRLPRPALQAFRAQDPGELRGQRAARSAFRAGSAGSAPRATC